MEKFHRSRRRFLGALITVLAGTFCLGRYLTPKMRPQERLLSVAKDDLPPQGALVYREARVAVMREGGEVYALNLVCTHLGCSVSVTATGLVCPCHGSSFDRQGRVLKGPADRSLERLRVEAEGDFYHVVV